MRFLLDTNILIPLEDSSHVLEESLANFVRLAHEHNHQLLYHPASEDDFRRDSDTERRRQNLDRIKLYTRLEGRPPCPWNSLDTRPNEAAENEILYALECDAVHALITEDRGIHDKASLSEYTVKPGQKSRLALLAGFQFLKRGAAHASGWESLG
jgi:hypothetical protein